MNNTYYNSDFSIKFQFVHNRLLYFYMGKTTIILELE